MKIEGPFHLIRGEGHTATSPRTPLNHTPERTQADSAEVIKLVQTENKRAMLADPDSLAEAKALVSDLIANIKEKDEEQLEKVHRIDASLLFRLV